MGFIEAITEVLKLNNNAPMSSDEILSDIYKRNLPLKTKGKSPERTINVMLNRSSINSTVNTIGKNICFEIVKGKTRRFKLIDFKKQIHEKTITLCGLNITVGYELDNKEYEVLYYNVNGNNIEPLLSISAICEIQESIDFLDIN